MTIDPRKLLREVAFAYVRAYERYEQAGARGNEDARDKNFAKVQEIEDCITVTERSGAWR